MGNGKGGRWPPLVNEMWPAAQPPSPSPSPSSPVGSGHLVSPPSSPSPVSSVVHSVSAPSPSPSPDSWAWASSTRSRPSKLLVIGDTIWAAGSAPLAMARALAPSHNFQRVVIVLPRKFHCGDIDSGANATHLQQVAAHIFAIGRLRLQESLADAARGWRAGQSPGALSLAMAS